MPPRRLLRRWPRLVSLTGCLVIVAAMSGTAAAAGRGSPPTLLAGQALTGVFSVQAGQCQAAGAPTGSYLELSERGLPVPNTSSPCVTYTLLSQGTQGLVSGAYQLDPNPTFDAKGNSLANGIFSPVTFLGTRFGGATTCSDQQHSPTPSGSCAKGTKGFAPPQLFAEPVGTGGCTASLISALGNPSGALSAECLYGNLLGFGVTWNGNGTCASGNAGSAGCYDQGAQTDASLKTQACVDSPTADCSISGTYDPSSHAYTLTIVAEVIGTSFNGAIGTYHLTGRFAARQVGSSSSSSGSGSSSQKHGSGSGQAGPAGGTPPGPRAAGSATESVTTLEGVFHIAAGSCAGADPPNGSWIQLSKGGGPISNPSSPCSGGNYTPVSQGTTGLLLGSFQPNPTPTFDGSGNSLADAIIAPTAFLGTKFGAASDPQNEQSAPTGADVFPAPTATVNGESLSADVSAVNFTYNGPANGSCASGGGTGCYAVGSTSATGSYDAATGSYVLGWTATISGGAFNGASATFHLTGQFVGREVTRTVTLGSVAPAPVAPATGVAPGTASPTVSGAGASAGASSPTVPGSALGGQGPPSSGTPAGSADAVAAIGPLNLAGSGVGLLPTILEILSLALLAGLLVAGGSAFVRRAR